MRNLIERFAELPIADPVDDRPAQSRPVLRRVGAFGVWRVGVARNALGVWSVMALNLPGSEKRRVAINDC